MKVQVNLDDCEAQGKCVRLCPQVFELDDDDVLHILTAEVAVEHRERVQHAVRVCPKQALSLAD